MLLKVDTEQNLRIDQFLTSHVELSRSKIRTMILNNLILVNDKPIKASYIVKLNDNISVEEFVEEELSAEAEEMDLDIVYEDDDLLVVNKENGMVVHPAVGNKNHTLVNGLMYHSKLSDINGMYRPGIVHRIDAYTTGLLVVAKNNKAHEFLQKQLEEKTVTRKYQALVWGVINHDTGTIDAPIGRDSNDRKKQAVTSINSKNAVTHFKVLERYKNASLIELSLETGRTHQIRVHMEYIGFPIVNDPVYGKRKLINNSGQCLHAKTLGFIHPTTKDYLEFDSPLPECFEEIREILKNQE